MYLLDLNIYKRSNKKGDTVVIRSLSELFLTTFNIVCLHFFIASRQELHVMKLNIQIFSLYLLEIQDICNHKLYLSPEHLPGLERLLLKCYQHKDTSFRGQVGNFPKT